MEEASTITPNSRGLESCKRHRTFIICLLLILGSMGIAMFMLLPAVRTPVRPPPQNVCRNNLKQIALALREYANLHHALPPACTVDANGKPLHSWRTLILPFLEEQELYDSIDLTKPWNDPVNEFASNTKISTYQCPATAGSDNRTTYLAVLSPTSCLKPIESRELSDIHDQPSQTLMLIEVDAKHAVPWMEPVDADESVFLDLGEPNAKLAHSAGIVAAFVDGSTRFLSKDLPAKQRQALISISGNDNAATAGGK